MTKAFRPWLRAVAIRLAGAMLVSSVVVVVNRPAGLTLLVMWVVSIPVTMIWTWRLSRALGYVHRGQLDRAARTLATLGPPMLDRRRRRAHLATVRALLAQQRGQLDLALQLADECVARMPSPKIAYEVVYWSNQVVRAGLLLELDRSIAAREAIRRIGEARPPMIRAMGRLTLHAAFAGVAELPGPGEAYACLQTEARRSEATPVTFALIGWTLEQRGDERGAMGAFQVAAARLDAGGERFDRSYPKVWAAVVARLDEARTASAAGIAY